MEQDVLVTLWQGTCCQIVDLSLLLPHEQNRGVWDRVCDFCCLLAWVSSVWTQSLAEQQELQSHFPSGMAAAWSEQTCQVSLGGQLDGGIPVWC